MTSSFPTRIIIILLDNNEIIDLMNQKLHTKTFSWVNKTIVILI